MPDKKITYKKGANGTVYVYYTTRAYRNKNGKPTSDEVAIGKKDAASGKLIPNKRYYEIFHGAWPTGTCDATVKSIRSCGNTVALHEISGQIGLSGILKKCFPSNWGQLLACSFYMVCEGNVMMYIGDWFDETKVHFAERMDDIDCSKLFAAITEEDRRLFFSEWVRHRGEKEYIAYDVSSISTYSKNIEIAEWGYNRDNDSLPQVNLGMCYGMTTHMPVYYDIYSGSIPDKVYLEFMMTGAKSLGINGVCFVTDRGFVMEDNIVFMSENGFSLITALPGNRLEAVRLIDESKGGIRKAANRIGKYEVYGIRKELTMHGVDFHAHVYYDPEKQLSDEKELYARIERLRAELGKMAASSKRATKKHTDFFDVAEEKKDALTYELNMGKVDERLGRAGFFVLLSSKLGLGSCDVLGIYRDRDLVEKSFDNFKNRLDFKRMRTHYDKTMEGKMFVGFLALILRTCMLRKVKGNPLTRHLTLDKVLVELRKIRAVSLTGIGEVLAPLTRLQKTVLDVLNVPHGLLG
jgi:transposase